MALLKLDTKSLYLRVEVGAKEEYKPTKQIRGLCNKVEKAKKDLNKFINETWKGKTMEELSELFSKDKKELAKWEKYMEEVYNPLIKELLTTIDNINYKICPNYKDYKNSLGGN